MVAWGMDYATPRHPALADCDFYHRMVLPGLGEVGTEWDLRPGIDDYLGRTAFSGARVLEIGPASGFLTAHMESGGAEVVSVELPLEHGWDVVPRAGIAAGWLAERRRIMDRIYNGFWLVHRRLGLRSRLAYARVPDLPESIGPFDVAVIASVLGHCRDPMGVLARCGALTTRRMVVTEAEWVRIDTPYAVMVLNPHVGNDVNDAWWFIPAYTVVTMLRLMGFDRVEVIRHAQTYLRQGCQVPHYTVVGERD